MTEFEGLPIAEKSNKSSKYEIHQNEIDGKLQIIFTEGDLPQYGPECIFENGMLVLYENDVLALNDSQNKYINTSNNIVWIPESYVDNFGESTDSKFVINKSYFTGKFNNSATTNSKLNVKLLIDKQNIAIVLYEYGTMLVKNSYSRSEPYTITMKTGDGTIFNIGGYMPSGADRIAINEGDKQTIINALSGIGDVSFHIVETNRKTTQYTFKGQAANFSKIYAELIGN